MQIRFEDGDYAEKVSRKNPNHILTVWEYMRIYETDPPPLEENDEIVATLSPRQMYASRCKWCELCMKPDCGSCATCVNNSRASSGHVREVCLQKVRNETSRNSFQVSELILLHAIGVPFQMCLEIPISQKKQPAVGLPPNWTSCSLRIRRYFEELPRSYIPVSSFITPNTKLRRFDRLKPRYALCTDPQDFQSECYYDFNTHIGIFARDKAKGKKQRAEPRSTSLAVSQKPNAAGVGTAGLSPRDLYANRCKQVRTLYETRLWCLLVL